MKIAFFLVLAILTPPAFADSKTSKSTQNPAETPPSSQDSEFDLSVVPAGEPVKGLKIPFYGPDGVTLQMMIHADVARRIDDENIIMENLKIEGSSEDGKKFYVEFPDSVFHMSTKKLTGNNGVQIHREDMEIVGKSAEFDIKTRFGKVIGNVKMTIFNMEELE